MRIGTIHNTTTTVKQVSDAADPKVRSATDDGAAAAAAAAVDVAPRAAGASGSRSDRIASIRAQIAAGTYAVDLVQLAVSLTDDELARSGR